MSKIKILLIILIVCSASIGFSQEEPAPQEEIILQQEIEQQEQTEVDGESAEKIVKIIEIKGNKAISINTILSKVKTTVNQPYQPRITSDDIKRLYKTGYFSDVSISIEDYEDGLKVIFNVVERPIVDSITINGAKAIKETKHKEALETKAGGYLDLNMLKKDIGSIKRNYEELGFSLSKVDYKINIDENTNHVNVEINIEEKQRFRVKRIIIEGSQTFDDKRIIKIMKTRTAWLFNRGLLKQDVLDEDAQRIKAFYNREGFLDAEAKISYHTDLKIKSIIVNVDIKEGIRYLVGSVTIKGNKIFTQDQLKSELKNSILAKVFSQEGLLEDVYNIQTLYFNKGYIFAQIKDTTSINPETKNVDIVFDIVENEIAYVGKIKIKGNIKTKDVVIRRELRIFPGDVFDGEKIKRSRERLNNLGFFEEVNFDTEASSEPHARDLAVEVKETKTGEFSFGGGYSSVEELVGFVEIAQKNFDWRNWPYFTGDGQDLRVRAEIGSIGGEYDLSFTEPWLFDYPISGGFDLYKSFHERESDVGYAYDEDRQGGDLRLGKDLSEHLKADLMYRIEEIDIADIDPSATNELKKEEGSNLISSISSGLTYDKRDNIYNPTTGFVVGGNLELAGGFLGADKDFTKFYGHGSKYFGLLKGSVLELKVRIGLADSFSDTDDVPIYERFYAGGAYTIRGYDERSVGPIDLVTEDPIGGESMLVLNAEYLYPVVEFIKAAVFFDTGEVWRRVDDFGTGGFKSGAGVGVRVKTPIGPVKLDYGFPLNLASGEEKKEGRFHFSFSRGF